MLRAKTSHRRPSRLFRLLRFEPLENRSLLSAGGAGGAPPVITLEVVHEIADCWDFEGEVTDKSGSTAGLTVDFGGVLAKYHLTATVEADGSYTLTKEIRNLRAGTATAQTRNAAGMPSNVAMDFVDSRHYGSGTSPGGALSSDPSTSPSTATISTIAGISRYLGDGNAAIDATLNSPRCVAVDTLGDLFIADTYNNVIREVNAFSGNISTVAGNGITGYSGDSGPAAAAELNSPRGIAVDAAGDLFIADSGNCVIRRVNHATHVITTIAGNGSYGFGGDGQAATAAELGCPNGVAVNSAGNLLVVADSDNNVVRKIDLSQTAPVIVTVAGNYSLGSGYSGDGYAAASAQLSYPVGVAVDSNGNLFIADTGNNVVRKVDSTGLISTVAGNYALGGGYSGNDSAATNAQLNAPTGVAVDNGGNLFIADSANDVVRKVNPLTQTISAVAGNGTWGFSNNGCAALSAELSNPTAIAVDPSGNLFFTDDIDNVVREVNASTVAIETVAGSGAGFYAGDGSAAAAAQLYNPTAVAANSAGNLFVADSNNNAIRAINMATGVITTVAGNGTWGYGGDNGAATSATVNDPMSVAVDAGGDLFIADAGNNVIRKVDSDGTITTIAGNFTLGSGYSGDGYSATSARLNAPTGLALDASGHLFIADTGNNVIRKVDLATGTITTVAGNFALGSGFSGDGYAATAAQLDAPNGIAVDAAGYLFIADSGNNVIRKVSPGGIITTVAGSYALGPGDGGDGYAATSAQLCGPNSVAVDAAGNLFIADTGNHVIRQVDSTGTISTFAGNFALGPGYSGDGRAAALAQLYDPAGIVTDGNGNLYIADSVNNVIRKVAPPLYWDPSQTSTANAGGAGTWSPGNATRWYDPVLGADVGWSQGSNAIFAGAGGTVTISGTVRPASITFVSNNYVIAGAASTDSLATAPTSVLVNVASDRAEIDASVTGNGILTVISTGVLVLGGPNVSDGTDLEAGTIQLADAEALGNGRLIVNGGKLDLNGKNITVGSLSGRGGVITNNDTATTSTLVVTQTSAAAFNGSIQDGTGIVCLTVSGPGVLVLPNSNTFSGSTAVTAGRLVLATPATLLDGSSLTVGADALAVFGPGAPAPPGNGGPTSQQDSGGSSTSGGGGGTTPPADVPPIVTSIQCVGQSIIDANSATFSVVFSKPVTGVTVANFAVRGGRGIIASLSGSDSQYMVAVSGIHSTSNDAIGLALVNAATIKDWYGTPLAETAIAVNQQFTIDTALYWDASGGNGPEGGSGAWSPGVANWHVGSPSGPLQGWVDGSQAFFAGAPGTIQITSPVVVADVNFLSDGFVIQGAAMTLVSGSTQGASGSTIAVAAGTATVNCQMAGGAMTKAGHGMLALGAANSYSSTTVAAGLLQARNGQGLPVGTSLLLNDGAVDLGGNTAVLGTVTLISGSIVDGAMEVATSIQIYSGTVLADLGGSAALQKRGPGGAALRGNNTYRGGTSVQGGVLVAANVESLPPGGVTGSGTVVTPPTLYWSGNGVWNTGQWQLADGTPTAWIDGSNVVLAAGSHLTISDIAGVSAVTASGSVTIDGGRLALPSWGGTVTVRGGTVTINSSLAGGELLKLGSGELVLNSTLAYANSMVTIAGTLDLMSPLTSPPITCGGRTIGPGAIFSSAGTSLYDLDPAIFALVQNMFTSGAVDRRDMIQILQTAVVGGALTPVALDALVALADPRNQDCLSIPDDAAVLARDVVDGNRANAFYQGQPLGNLEDQRNDQARAVALEDLVNKWFYGGDLPTTPVGAYSVTAGSLFGDNPNAALDIPSSADMRQGSIGDCYFIAALGALADSSPVAIQNMLIDNGVEKGVHAWTVRFYHDTPQGYAADYVTINDILPGYTATYPVYAKPGPNGGWWIPLVEKAYAQWNETGLEGRNGQNSYASLSAGWMDAVDEQILGQAAAAYSPLSPGARQALAAAIQAGTAVTAAIFTDGNPLFSALHLFSSHAYQVVSYDSDPQSAGYGTFQLANPWGAYEPSPLTWSEVTEFCAGIVVAKRSSSAATSSDAAVASTQAVRVSALEAVSARRYASEAAILANFAVHRDASDSTRDLRIRALDLLMAGYGKA